MSQVFQVASFCGLYAELEGMIKWIFNPSVIVWTYAFLFFSLSFDPKNVFFCSRNFICWSVFLNLLAFHIFLLNEQYGSGQEQNWEQKNSCTLGAI